MTVTFSDETTVPNDARTLLTDAVPDLSDVEYPCEVCGKEAGPYGGRGRKPKRCSEHKKSQSRSTATTKVSGTNEKLAAQATEALCAFDGMAALGATVIGFTSTAETIQEADEIFRVRVYAALLNSPDTARKILRYGSKAGDSALFIAIGLHIATILPVFMTEAKQKKAEREAKRIAEEEANS